FSFLFSDFTNFNIVIFYVLFSVARSECGIEESLEQTQLDMILLNKLVEKNKKLLDMFQKYDSGKSIEEIMKDSKK
uniref:hypothetical protein n=1 Tax=Aliarcobacter cryaerophilus TaxID=28198 RepID=UPI001C63ECE0